eukprot:3212376-Amphidinium_carterae.3
MQALEELQHLMSGGARFVSQDREKGRHNRSLTLGLYTRQGMGICKHTREPAARKLIRWIGAQMRRLGEEFTTITINKVETGQCIHIHVDRYNWGNSINHVLVLGVFDGGQLWMSTPGGVDKPPAECCTEEGHSELRGDMRSTVDQWLRLQPHTPHAIATVRSGTRWSIVVSCMGQLESVEGGLWNSLSQAGFPVQRLRQEAGRRRKHEAERMGVEIDNKILFRPWRGHPSMRVMWSRALRTHPYWQKRVLNSVFWLVQTMSLVGFLNKLYGVCSGVTLGRSRARTRRVSST